MHDQQLLRSAPGAFRETDVDKSRFEPAGAPRYLVLAETLREQIMAGEPPVGELLPQVGDVEPLAGGGAVDESLRQRGGAAQAQAPGAPASRVTRSASPFACLPKPA